MCSPYADSELTPAATTFCCQQEKQTLQSGGRGHVEGEGDEEIGEIGGRGMTAFPRKGDLGCRCL